MIRLKIYLWNAFFSSLIGLVVHILALFLMWDYLITRSLTRIDIINLIISTFSSTVIGAIIGTVSLFFLLQIFLRLKQKPFFGFLSNFLVVAGLNIAGAMIFNHVRDFNQFLQTLWFYALIFSEVLSFFLTYAWLRKIMLYKEKLELKKAALHDQSS